MAFTKKQIEDAARFGLSYFGDDQVSYNRCEVRKPVPVTTSAKCPCCGSRQFVTHHSRRICSYCRNEQDGQAQSSGPLVEQYRSNAAKMSAERYINYSARVRRPEAIAKITIE